MIALSVLLLGLSASALSVFIGPGGGIIFIPLLPVLFGLSVHEAVATSLVSIFFVVSENSYRFSKMQVVRWSVVYYIGTFSVISALLAAQWAQRVDEKFILTLFLGLLVVVGLKTLLDSFLTRNFEVSPQLSTQQKIGLAVGGIIAGLASGLTGVGAGVILIPLMIVLKVVSPEQLVPTANANMMCTTCAGALSYFLSGHFVSWQQWGLIRIDVALGVFLVSSIAGRFFRPHQNKLPFRIKTLLLFVLILVLIIRIAYKIMQLQ